MKKPIKIFYSELGTPKFYATQYYKDRGNGLFEITGEKFDVTQDIANIIVSRDVVFNKISQESNDGK